jgi:hypothetical protein
MQASLELAVAAVVEVLGVVVMVAAVATVKNGSKFSQCNMVWGGFPQARDSGCLRFDSDGYFIST